MSLSFLTPSRTILMISDDALFVYSLNAKGVKLVEAVPWEVENFESSVATIIAKDCGGKPVLILNDMVEQHYRKEKVPKVSPFDKQNVIQRKLKVAFPNYPVRAALGLKEKIPKTANTLAGQVYIFAAIPASDSFKKTMAAATKSLAPIAGFCLLPVESSDLVKKLSEKFSGKSGQKQKWTIFIGQHQGGGLRQIVIKNGELALTRMTPISVSQDDTEAWCNEVHQEFNATMSYLSRFGFDPSDGLNVIVLADQVPANLISEKIDTPCNFYSFTNRDVKSLLGINLGAAGEDEYADMLHVSWIGRKSKFILPMKAKQIDNVSKPRQIAVIASILMLLGGCFQAYQLVDYLQKVSANRDDIESIEQRKAQLELQYQKEVKRKQDMGFDIQLIQSSLSVYEALEKTQVDVFPLFYNIGLALGRDMRIDRVEVIRGRPSFFKKLLGGDKKDRGIPSFSANMQLTFPSTTNAQKGNKQVQDLRERLQMMLPDHVIEVTKLLEDYEYSEEIVVETGETDSKKTKQDYVAEISIEGPVIE